MLSDLRAVYIGYLIPLSWDKDSPGINVLNLLHCKYSADFVTPTSISIGKSSRKCFFKCLWLFLRYDYRHILSLFIYLFFLTFIYNSIYLFLRKLDWKFEWIRAHAYHKINRALSGLYNYMWKKVLLCWDPALHVTESQQRK